MPFLDGPSTINALRRLDPNVRILAASGMSEHEGQAEQLTGTELLLKPFTTERLLTTVGSSAQIPGRGELLRCKILVIDDEAMIFRQATACALQRKGFETLESCRWTEQDALDAASLKRYAAELGLNVKQFEIDFSSEKSRRRGAKGQGRG